MCKRTRRHWEGGGGGEPAAVLGASPPAASAAATENTSRGSAEGELRGKKAASRRPLTSCGCGHQGNAWLLPGPLRHVSCAWSHASYVRHAQHAAPRRFRARLTGPFQSEGLWFPLRLQLFVLVPIRGTLVPATTTTLRPGFYSPVQTLVYCTSQGEICVQAYLVLTSTVLASASPLVPGTSVECESCV